MQNYWCHMWLWLILRWDGTCSLCAMSQFCAVFTHYTTSKNIINKAVNRIYFFHFHNFYTRQVALDVTLRHVLVPFTFQIHTLTWVTWSCMHQAGSIECFPSGLGLSRRSCHQCGRSWHSRSWWRLCRGSAVRWGRTHMIALCAPLPWGWGHGCRLDRQTCI